MTDKKDFGFLGNDFQIKLIAQILCDRKFGLNIIGTVTAKYFENPFCRQMISLIKNYNNKYDNALPTLSGLKEAILSEIKDDVQKTSLLEMLKDVKKKALDDDKATQELALNYCKQQEVLKAISEVTNIVKKGDFQNYTAIEDIMRKAMSIADSTDDSSEVDEDLDSAFSEDYRKPIPTGIEGLDVEIGGGLGRGELAVFLAPSGVGKTTFLTKVANTGYRVGYNVLQLFFEDPKKTIQRKHGACSSGIALNQIDKNIEAVKESVYNLKKGGGKLILKKCPSDSTTTYHIKQYLRYQQNKGVKIDLLIIDYLDCLVAGKSTEEQTANESLIMRQLETIAGEFDIAIWVAVQTNRVGAGSDVVTTDQVQGSFKRVQVAHLIVTAAKSAEQKVNGLANVMIAKSRFGGDGIVFKDMVFRNDTIYFDTKESSLVSQLAYDEDANAKIEANKQAKAAEALRQFQENRERAEQQKLATATL